MKVLFLDIDGVVKLFDPESWDVNRRCAQRVNTLCKEFGLKVVISSSWRKDAVEASDDWRTAHLTDEWRGVYHWLHRNMGLSVDVIGVTPIMGDPNVVEPGVRGKEIKAWLAEHPEVTQWVILDDFAEWLGPDVMDRAVITEQRYTGFDDVALEAARKMFA